MSKVVKVNDEVVGNLDFVAIRPQVTTVMIYLKNSDDWIEISKEDYKKIKNKKVLQIKYSQILSQKGINLNE